MLPYANELVRIEPDKCFHALVSHLGDKHQYLVQNQVIGTVVRLPMATVTLRGTVADAIGMGSCQEEDVFPEYSVNGPYTLTMFVKYPDVLTKLSNSA